MVSDAHLKAPEEIKAPWSFDLFGCLKMEETIPLMVSDAHLKAPEEIKAPRRHAREQEELTHDERAAKRRLKKAHRRKELERKVDTGKMTLSGLRERTEVLNRKNKEAKLEKEKK